MSIPKSDNTLCYNSSMKHFFFSSGGENPIIELEHGRMRIGCWYITLEAFSTLGDKWVEFRSENNKLRIQG